MEFGHENLDVYRLALEVARFAATRQVPAQRRHLGDQLVRAADSVVLNIAEGAGKPRGASRCNHLRIALGSASEVDAVFDLLGIPYDHEIRHKLRRVGAMLGAMTR